MNEKGRSGLIHWVSSFIFTCGRGEISAERCGLKNRWRNPWGFESPRPYQEPFGANIRWVRDSPQSTLEHYRNEMRGWATLCPPRDKNGLIRLTTRVGTEAGSTPAYPKRLAGL